MENNIVFIEETDEDVKDFEEFTREMTRILELKEDLKTNLQRNNSDSRISISSNESTFIGIKTNIWGVEEKKEKEDSRVFKRNFEKIKKRKAKKKERNWNETTKAGLKSPQSVSTCSSNRRLSCESESFIPNRNTFKQLNDFSNLGDAKKEFQVGYYQSQRRFTVPSENAPINFISNTKTATNNKLPRNQKKTQTNLDTASNRINLESILRGKDKRTTLMIRHIPNKYNLQTMMEDINVDFKDKYDVFYLPIDYANNCNLGFAFINFVDSLHILQFYEVFRGKKWRRFNNSEKICELAYAKFQGKKELIAHFEKGSVLTFESEEKKPVILPTPDILPPVDLPLKYFQSFVSLYPYSDCQILQNRFSVKALFAF